jgi:molecular chaperone GrpE
LTEGIASGDHPSGESMPSDPDVSARLQAFESGIAEFHRRSEHQERVIDHLHRENQELRAGVRRSMLEPIVTDLIRLHDEVAREARRLEVGSTDPGAISSLLRSYLGDVELTLERCGLDAFSGEPGEPYRPGEHRPVGVIPTADPALHNTVAVVVSTGFFDREQGKVRRPMHAKFHQHTPVAVGDSPGETPLTDRE